MEMDKATRKKLQDFFKAILTEAENNEAFSRKLLHALYGDIAEKAEEPKKKRSNRRDPAVLNPIQMVLDGDAALETRLSELSEKQLKDIIADYSMDPNKLASRWRKKERLIGLIIETARHRASKGDAFRD